MLNFENMSWGYLIFLIIVGTFITIVLGFNTYYLSVAQTEAENNGKPQSYVDWLNILEIISGIAAFISGFSVVYAIVVVAFPSTHQSLNQKVVVDKKE